MHGLPSDLQSEENNLRMELEGGYQVKNPAEIALVSSITWKPTDTLNRQTKQTLQNRPGAVQNNLVCYIFNKLCKSFSQGLKTLIKLVNNGHSHLISWQPSYISIYHALHLKSWLFLQHYWYWGDGQISNKYLESTYTYLYSLCLSKSFIKYDKGFDTRLFSLLRYMGETFAAKNT